MVAVVGCWCLKKIARLTSLCMLCIAFFAVDVPHVPDLAFVQVVQAQSRCSIREEPLPRSCAALNAAGVNTLWKGSFSGECRQGSNRRRHFGHGCFRTEADCNDWLFRMNSVAVGSIRHSQCRQL